MLHPPSDLVMVERILVAAGLGGVVGLERELSSHPAGLRTHVSLALGAALFGVMSVGGFNLVGLSETSRGALSADVSRIASNVVVGVGFLGGGAILKEGERVRGLTTAASLWVTAALGVAAGLGLYVPAVVSCAVLILALVGLRPARRFMTGGLLRHETLVVELAEGADPGGVIGVIGALPGVRLRSLQVGQREGKTVVRAYVVSARSVEIGEMLGTLSERGDVARVDHS